MRRIANTKEENVKKGEKERKEKKLSFLPFLFSPPSQFLSLAFHHAFRVPPPQCQRSYAASKK